MARTEHREINGMGPSAPRGETNLHLKLALAVLAPLTHVVLYTGANRFPLFEPAVLPLSHLDLAVPLIPQTVWIYLSDYALVLFAFLLCRDLVRFAAVGFSVIGLAVVVQWLMPVAYPRALFPVDAAAGLSAAALVLLRSVDAPVSCVPSLHVALTTVSALAIWRAPPRWHPVAISRLFFVWTGAVAVSTLTVKQHYAVDVLGGLILAAVVDRLVTQATIARARALAVAWLSRRPGVSLRS
jgi:membrane-associated phospholipid phosphatase